MSEVSSEYSKALYMLAMEKGCSDEYKEALDIVSDVFEKNPVYKDFLSTFAIPLEERLNALEEAFSNAVHRDILSFLKIICEKKHISEFTECARQYSEMCDETNRISSAKVTSAVELTDKEKALLKEKLEKTTGNSVVIDYTVDKSILGGLIVETDGKIMDSSLKKHLTDIKDVIKK